MISREAGYASINKGTCQRKQSLSPRQKGAAMVHIHSAQGQQHLKQTLHFMALGVLRVPRAESKTVLLFLTIFHTRVLKIMSDLHHSLER